MYFLSCAKVNNFLFQKIGLFQEFKTSLNLIKLRTILDILTGCFWEKTLIKQLVIYVNK